MITEKLTNLEIDIERFNELFSPEVRTVADALRKYGFDVRVVGGAVRDFLLGREPRDIDFATDADPSEIIWVLNREGIEHDDWGIGHGTIKAVFGDEKVDITSIAYKIEIKDGKVRIVTGRDWEQDALRRDLTINSMSIDSDGTLYDYTGGLEDLRSQTIRMNPGTAGSIQDDPNIIVRWFKSMGMFDKPNWPRKDYDAVKSSVQHLKGMRGDDRVQKGLASILTSKNSKGILSMMCRSGAGRYLGIDCA
jgi:tRNA nucleotidyltransferase/poly(A) polymerase